MKINILFEIKEGPWGGGNQFLKSLKKKLVFRGVYEDDIEKTDVVLFNSFQDMDKVVSLKKKYQEKIFVHRVDGPISMVRGRDRIIDTIIFKLNDAVADTTIFQSKWSKIKSEELGIKPNRFETIIYNAPDESIFFKKTNGLNIGKIKLVASSWSDNMKKGFAYYQFLDETLDFQKYEMTFIGRSPIKFKNIKMTGPLSSTEVAKVYRESDIYITATKDEPCSNALIEAISSGLPAVYLNSGGNSELVSKGGEAFENKEEIQGKIIKIINNYDNYVKDLPIFEMNKTAGYYADFFKKVLGEKESGKYVPKKITLGKVAKIYILVFIWKFGAIFSKIKTLSWK